MDKLEQQSGAIRIGRRSRSTAARVTARLEVERVVDGEAFDYALRIVGYVEPDGSVAVDGVEVMDICEGRPPLGDLSPSEMERARKALADSAADERVAR